MSDTIESAAPAVAATPAVSTTPAPAPEPSATAQALARCRQAYRQAYAAESAKGLSDYFCHRSATDAYRLAMPSTETLADIKALVSCIVQGINFKVYDSRDATQLLYAAQIAVTVHNKASERK